MSVLQTLCLSVQVAMEEEEHQLFQETRVLTDEVVQRGVSVLADGGHFVPADAGWTGEDINICLEDSFVFRAFVDEEEDDDASGEVAREDNETDPDDDNEVDDD